MERVDDNPKKGKTTRAEVGSKDGGVAPAVVVSASSSAEKAKIARAKARPMDGGSKRSRTRAPDT